MESVVQVQIQKYRITPYYSQEERDLTLSMLSIVVDEHPETWQSHLGPICMTYNTSLQPTTGYSPFYLMFGRLPIDIVYGTNQPQSQTVSSFISNMSTVLGNAYDMLVIPYD